MRTLPMISLCFVLSLENDNEAGPHPDEPLQHGGHIRANLWAAGDFGTRCMRHGSCIDRIHV